MAKERNKFAREMMEKFHDKFPEIAVDIKRVTPRDNNSVLLVRNDGRKYMFMFCNDIYLLARL